MFPNAEYIKTLVNGLKEFVNSKIKLVRKDIDSLPQADWNQNDSAAKDYVKNRAHYVERRQGSIAGAKYAATYNGTEHGEIPFALGQVWNADFETRVFDNLEVKRAGDTLYIGDLTLNQIPFYVTKTSGGRNSGWANMMHPGGLTLTGVSGIAEFVTVHKIQEEFIPASIARLADVKAQVQADWNETNVSSEAYIKNKPLAQRVGYFSVASTATSTVLSSTSDYSFVIFLLNDKSDGRFSITKAKIGWHGVKDVLSCKTGKAITSDELPYCRMVCVPFENTLLCINPC